MENQKDEAPQAKGVATPAHFNGQGADKRVTNKSSDVTEGLVSESTSSGPGRLKKTAMKFFGGKKSICTLPSFFGGGRSKASGKGSSKKFLSNSKTRDGLSEVEHGSEDTDTDGAKGSLFLPQLPCQLPSYQNAHGILETVSRSKLSLVVATEQTGTERNHPIPKPKKGLKGFFSSIRRLQKSKVSGTGQNEPRAKKSEGVRTRPQEQMSSTHLSKTDGILQTFIKENTKPPNVPVSNIPLAIESSEASEKVVYKDSEKSMENCVSAFQHSKPVLKFSGPEELHTPETGEKVVTGEANLSSSPVGDQLSLFLGDVTSLKSFDSLTGCGDIIAEQDMDSMTDSMASGGQRANRDGTKRSSCLVTYQGGGEEMALPDEDDEEEEEGEEEELGGEVIKEEEDNDLTYLWTNAQMYPRSNLSLDYHPITFSGHHSGYMLLDPGQSCPVLALGDLLTPLSDQQESAPNSDEGYYDSTTPGLEDDSGETLGLIHRDCLPRDSYSGDALYEFYEPGDSLKNSPPQDDCFYDLHGHNSEMFAPFLNFEPFSPSRPPGAMETEEERLVTIQKQLLYWELRREQLEAKEALEAHAREVHTNEGYTQEINAHSQETHTQQAHVRKDQLQGTNSREVCTRKTCVQEICARDVPIQESHVRDIQAQQGKSIMEYQMRPLFSSVVDRIAAISDTSKITPRGTTSAFPSTGNSEPDWRDLRPLEKRYEGNCSKKDQSTYLMQLFQSDSMFEPDIQEANFAGSPRRAYPTYTPLEEPEEEEVEKEGNATVSFSQALVEFTSNGNIFSSMSCSSDSESSFTQNLPELPPMVTFDIADVEKDGEGKCEENPEFQNEDLAASLEAFELGYYQKHSFNNYHSQFYQGLPWGISSLPRYLGLSGLHLQPPPAAMTFNKRSRSLDTAETLSNPHLTQGHMESDELHAQQEELDEEEEEWDRESPLSLCTEPPGISDWPVCVSCPLPVESGSAWISPSQFNGLSTQSPCKQAVCSVSPVNMSMLLSSPVPEIRALGESEPQLAHPSHLILPMSPSFNFQSQTFQSENARPQDILLPVDDPSCSSSSGVFTYSLLPQAKPMGITHDIPNIPRVQLEPLMSHISYGSSLDLSNERADQGASLFITSYSSSTNEKLSD